MSGRGTRSFPAIKTAVAWNIALRTLPPHIGNVHIIEKVYLNTKTYVFFSSCMQKVLRAFMSWWTPQIRVDGSGPSLILTCLSNQRSSPLRNNATVLQAFKKTVLSLSPLNYCDDDKSTHQTVLRQSRHGDILIDRMHWNKKAKSNWFGNLGVMAWIFRIKTHGLIIEGLCLVLDDSLSLTVCPHLLRYMRPYASLSSTWRNLHL